MGLFTGAAGVLLKALPRQEMNTLHSGRVEESKRSSGGRNRSFGPRLVRYYRLSEEEASEAEKDLEVWFHVSPAGVDRARCR